MWTCSYREIGDDCFKEKKFIVKYIRFFFYCTVFVSVISLGQPLKIVSYNPHCKKISHPGSQ